MRLPRRGRSWLEEFSDSALRKGFKQELMCQAFDSVLKRTGIRRLSNYSEDSEVPRYVEVESVSIEVAKISVLLVCGQ